MSNIFGHEQNIAGRVYSELVQILIDAGKLDSKITETLMTEQVNEVLRPQFASAARHVASELLVTIASGSDGGISEARTNVMEALGEWERTESVQSSQSFMSTLDADLTPINLSRVNESEAKHPDLKGEGTKNPIKKFVFTSHSDVLGEQALGINSKKEDVQQKHKKKNCVSRCYGSMEFMRHAGLHFEDAYDEHLFLQKYYFRSSMHVEFSCTFAVAQLTMATFWFFDSGQYFQLNRVFDSGSAEYFVYFVINGCVDAVLTLSTHIIEYSCMRKGRSTECTQLWHSVRMAIGFTAALLFYGALALIPLLPKRTYHATDDFITNGTNNIVNNSSVPCDDEINRYYSLFIFVALTPTLFLRSLPARLTFSILAIAFFVQSSVSDGSLFSLIDWAVLISTYVCHTDRRKHSSPCVRRCMCCIWALNILVLLGLFWVVLLTPASTQSLLLFVAGLGLVVSKAERESRRNFMAQSNWRYLQTHLLHRLYPKPSQSTSELSRLERVMREECPKELEWIRRVGDDADRVPLHTENIHKHIGVSADKVLYSRNFGRVMHDENLVGFHISANEIEELDHIDNGGQANVSRGIWKKWGGKHVNIAIKKWGSRRSANTLDDLEKYTIEVKALIQLKKHRQVATHNRHTRAVKCTRNMHKYSFTHTYIHMHHVHMGKCHVRLYIIIRHVIEFLGWSKSNDVKAQTVPVIVLKLAHGSIRSVVNKKLKNEIDITDERKMEWSAQLADAVTYMHSQDLIHRDIKPANVLVGDDAIIKLVSVRSS